MIARTVLDLISEQMVAGWETSGGGRDVTGKDFQVWEFRTPGELPPAPGARIEIISDANSSAKGVTLWSGKAAIILRLPTRIDAKNDQGEDVALRWVDEIRDAIADGESDALQILSVSLDSIESKGVAGIGGTPRIGQWQDDGSETIAALTVNFFAVDA